MKYYRYCISYKYNSQQNWRTQTICSECQGQPLYFSKHKQRRAIKTDPLQFSRFAVKRWNLFGFQAPGWCSFMNEMSEITVFTNESSPLIW